MDIMQVVESDNEPDYLGVRISDSCISGGNLLIEMLTGHPSSLRYTSHGVNL